MRTAARCRKAWPSTSRTSPAACAAPTTPRRAAPPLVGTVGVRAQCGIHEWRPSPCREFGLRAPMGIGDEACTRARARHGLPPLPL